MKDFNYKFLTYIDPSSWIKKIHALEESAWFEWTEKQTVSKVHAKTTNIGLLTDINYGKDGPVKGQSTRFYNYFFEELQQVEKKLIEIYGSGYILRAELARLHRNEIVIPHVDKGKSLIGNQRVHLPIITDPKVKFNVNNEVIYMKPGNLTEINNTGIHGVENNSSIDRIHLIVDYYTNSTSIL